MYARINIDYHFYHFTQSVCTHVRTGFKAVTPLPQCMSFSHTMMCTHVSILITISIIFTQSVCTHVRTGFKAVTPLSQCMSSSHQNLIIFHGYQYFIDYYAISSVNIFFYFSNNDKGLSYHRDVKELHFIVERLTRLYIFLYCTYRKKSKSD